MPIFTAPIISGRVLQHIGRVPYILERGAYAVFTLRPQSVQGLNLRNAGVKVPCVTRFTNALYARFMRADWLFPQRAQDLLAQRLRQKHIPFRDILLLARAFFRCAVRDRLRFLLTSALRRQLRSAVQALRFFLCVFRAYYRVSFSSYFSDKCFADFVDFYGVFSAPDFHVVPAGSYLAGIFFKSAEFCVILLDICDRRLCRYCSFHLTLRYLFTDFFAKAYRFSYSQPSFYSAEKHLYSEYHILLTTRGYLDKSSASVICYTLF